MRRTGDPRTVALSGAAWRAGVVVVGVAAALVNGCSGGEEPVRSPLTVADLGPVEWRGPFADVEGGGSGAPCVAVHGAASVLPQ